MFRILAHAILLLGLVAFVLVGCGPAEEEEPRFPPPAATTENAESPPPAADALPGTAPDEEVATEGDLVPSGDRTSALGGVYTTAQAEIGRRVFENECALCHASAEFSGRVFQLTWAGRPLSGFFFQISNTMPLEAPGSLPTEEYVAVLAYILELNGYPAGDEPLPAEASELSEIQLDRLPD